MGGAYCLASTRMPVAQVKRMVGEVGRDWVKREYPWITDTQIDTALRFRKKEPPNVR
jgi:uncharacterized protein (DUF433 family)